VALPSALMIMWLMMPLLARSAGSSSVMCGQVVVSAARKSLPSRYHW